MKVDEPRCRDCGEPMPNAGPCKANKDAACHTAPHMSHSYTWPTKTCARCGVTDDDAAAFVQCTADGGREDSRVAAARYIHVWLCPGYAVNGNIAVCHGDAEPRSGYCVGVAMFGPLNIRPLPWVELVEYVGVLVGSLAMVIRNDRKNDDRDRGQRPFIETMVPHDFCRHDPSPIEIDVLREMAATSAPMVHAPTSRQRSRFTVGSRRVPWDDIMILERDGYIVRMADTPRDTGPRILTDHGRQIGLHARRQSMR